MSLEKVTANCLNDVFQNHKIEVKLKYPDDYHDNVIQSLVFLFKISLSTQPL